MGFDIANEGNIRDLTPLGNLMLGNEDEGVCALDSVPDALGQTTKFVGRGCGPGGGSGGVGQELFVVEFVACGIDNCICKVVVTCKKSVARMRRI